MYLKSPFRVYDETKKTMKKNQNSTVLCSIDDIPPDSAKGFTIEHEAQARRIIVLKMDDRLFIYENRCPHVGTPLDWVPDQFLDESNSLIQCATHGALFRPEDGYCVAGPCQGQSLKQITFKVTDKQIFV